MFLRFLSFKNRRMDFKSLYYWFSNFNWHVKMELEIYHSVCQFGDTESEKELQKQSRWNNWGILSPYAVRRPCVGASVGVDGVMRWCMCRWCYVMVYVSVTLCDQVRMCRWCDLLACWWCYVMMHMCRWCYDMV